MEGYILVYNQQQGIGTIVSDRERFWFHRDRIAKGPIDPQINDRVIFEILNKEVQPGRLRVATHIIILDDVTPGQNALVEKDVPEAK
jgi:hypothetical protein